MLHGMICWTWTDKGMGISCGGPWGGVGRVDGWEVKTGGVCTFMVICHAIGLSAPLDCNQKENAFIAPLNGSLGKPCWFSGPGSGKYVGDTTCTCFISPTWAKRESSSVRVSWCNSLTIATTSFKVSEITLIGSGTLKQPARGPVELGRSSPATLRHAGQNRLSSSWQQSERIDQMLYHRHPGYIWVWLCQQRQKP